MSQAPSPLRLIGDPIENFYILGKKHYDSFRLLQKNVLPGQESWQGKIQTLKQTLLSKKTEFHTQGVAEEWLSSYCQGLEVSVPNYLRFLEEVECGALSGRVLPGCTSVFNWDQDHQRVEHVRLLDWPFSLTPNETSELLFIHAPGFQKLLVLTIPGLPFLPLSMMNESGVTLALHAKYHHLDHPDGVWVGRIAFESMLASQSVMDLKKCLKRFQTKRLWGFHGCDPSGQILAMDIMGPQMDGQSFEMRDEKTLVFNNAPLVKDPQAQMSSEPPAFIDFCRERRRWGLEKMSATNDQTALLKLTKITKASKFRAPAVTASTIQALSFQPSSRRLEMLVGVPPMWSQGQVVTWNDLFETSMKESEESSSHFSKEDKLEWSVRKNFSDAQKAMDTGDVALAFHHIQMGLIFASGELKHQASWIWIWWQWKHLQGKRDRLHLPALIREQLKVTPSTHKPHLQFLLLLLEVELDLMATVSPPDLPPPFREWADAFVVAPLLKRQLMLKIPDARLDIQDCVPLTIPVWTRGNGIR